MKLYVLVSYPGLSVQHLKMVDFFCFQHEVNRKVTIEFRIHIVSYELWAYFFKYVNYSQSVCSQSISPSTFTVACTLYWSIKPIVHSTIFSSSNRMSNVVLTVGDKKLHVSKEVSNIIFFEYFKIIITMFLKFTRSWISQRNHCEIFSVSGCSVSRFRVSFLWKLCWKGKGGSGD